MTGKPSRYKTASKRRLRVGFLIHDVSRLRRTIYDQRLKPLNITRSQWWVLTNLARHETEEGVPQIELARMLDVGKVTLGGLIDRLEANGFVRRVRDVHDRRSKRVQITDKGWGLMDEIQSVAKGINKEIMADVSRQEEQVLIDLLARMKHNLLEMEAVPDSTARDNGQDDSAKKTTRKRKAQA